MLIKNSGKVEKSLNHAFFAKLRPPDITQPSRHGTEGISTFQNKKSSLTLVVVIPEEMKLEGEGRKEYV